MSVLIFVIGVAILLAAYFFYGNFLNRFFGVDDKRETPAHKHYDGVDYVPAKNWLVLFGHHFASIAGAGPIVGPVFAYMYWGWFGVFLWLIFGSIFIGAVHDFSAMILSVREGGASIGNIAKKYISKRASIIFLIFLWFALILVNAVFASLCAKSFISEPKIVMPSFGLIPVAVLVGILLYKIRANVLLTTVFGLLALTYLIFTSKASPSAVPIYSYQTWIIILFIYSFFASILPVNILLQPRDYLSSFLLFLGIALGFVGIFMRPLPLQSQPFFKFSSDIGPFFPVMFITVACGAISGFHALIASGTSSKQLPNESDARKIGYGAMITEAILAILVLVCVTFGLKNIPQGKTPVDIFAMGFSNVVFFMGNYAKFFALLLLNAFILTTLDTATRIGRYLTQELFGIKNKYFATLLVIAASGYLCFNDKWQIIWPVFGAANQLVAGLTLLVVSSFLLKEKKSCKITLIPAFIMFFITIYALILQAAGFIKTKNYLLFGLDIALIALGIIIIFEFIMSRKAGNISFNEE